MHLHPEATIHRILLFGTRSSETPVPVAQKLHNMFLLLPKAIVVLRNTNMWKGKASLPLVRPGWKHGLPCSQSLYLELNFRPASSTCVRCVCFGPDTEPKEWLATHLTAQEGHQGHTCLTGMQLLQMGVSGLGRSCLVYR
jgi:hypothetical protein